MKWREILKEKAYLIPGNGRVVDTYDIEFISTVAKMEGFIEALEILLPDLTGEVKSQLEEGLVYGRDKLSKFIENGTITGDL